MLCVGVVVRGERVEHVVHVVEEDSLPLDLVLVADAALVPMAVPAICAMSPPTGHERGERNEHGDELGQTGSTCRS